MEVILLERIAKLGQMGEIVRVKDGYARNFLLQRGKALRATERQQVQLRRHEGRSRGPQPQGQGRSDDSRRQDRRQERRRAAPGLGNRPAVRLGLAARHRRAVRGRRRRASPAPRSCSTRRSSRSASTRSRSRVHPEVEVIGDGHCRAQRRRSRAHQSRRGHLDAPGRPGRRSRSVGGRRRILRSRCPAGRGSQRRRSRLNFQSSFNEKPGIAGLFCELAIGRSAAAAVRCRKAADLTPAAARSRPTVVHRKWCGSSPRVRRRSTAPRRRFRPVGSMTRAEARASLAAPDQRAWAFRSSMQASRPAWPPRPAGLGPARRSQVWPAQVLQRLQAARRLCRVHSPLQFAPA